MNVGPQPIIKKNNYFYIRIATVRVMVLADDVLSLVTLGVSDKG